MSLCCINAKNVSTTGIFGMKEDLTDVSFRDSRGNKVEFEFFTLTCQVIFYSPCLWITFVPTGAVRRWSEVSPEGR